MLEAVVSSSVLILAIILIRYLGRDRISRRVRYALWGLVLLRLLLPVPLLDSPISVMHAVNTDRLETVAQFDVPIFPTGTTVDAVTGAYPAGPANPPARTPEQATEPQPEPEAETTWASLEIGNLAQLAWALGGLVTAVWFILTNRRFARTLKESRHPVEGTGCKLPVYRVEAAVSPCLFGLIKPAIYLTPKALEGEAKTAHVLAHELTHYRHLDHIWSCLRLVCLSVYWFNPLVWIAARLSRADCELACDESVIRRLGEENRLAYGRTLVDMIAVRRTPGAFACAATTMAASSRNIKARIRMIADNCKTVLPALLLTLIIAALAVGCTFTGAGNPAETDALSQKIEAGKADPNPLVAQAWRMIENDIALQEEWAGYAETESTGTAFLDAEITRLELTDSFDYLVEDALVEAYALEYRYLPEDPAQAVLPGGMGTDQDGWITEQGSPWLVAENRDGELRYIGTVYPMSEYSSVAHAVTAFYYSRSLEQRGEDPLALAPYLLMSSIGVSEDGQVFFRFPAELPNPEDLIIWVSGRVQTDQGGMSVHCFTAESENRSWIPDEVYAIDVRGKYFTSLTMDISLAGRDDDAAISVDLLEAFNRVSGTYLTISHMSDAYSPALSSVPGLRLDAVSRTGADKIAFETTNGGLVTWEDDIVSEAEPSLLLPYGTPVYWQPGQFAYRGELGHIRATAYDEQGIPIAVNSLYVQPVSDGSGRYEVVTPDANAK